MTTTYLCKPYVFTGGPLNHSRLGSSLVLARLRPEDHTNKRAGACPKENGASSGAIKNLPRHFSSARASALKKNADKLFYFRIGICTDGARARTSDHSCLSYVLNAWKCAFDPSIKTKIRKGDVQEYTTSQMLSVASPVLHLPPERTRRLLRENCTRANLYSTLNIYRSLRIALGISRKVNR